MKRFKYDAKRPDGKDEERPRSDLESALPPTAQTSDVFTEFTSRLKSRLHIDRGVLAVRMCEGAPLSAISTWKNGQTRHGLTIKLPAESSLFERVIGDGRVYTENYCGSFSGNFFERKLLIDDATRSFVLQPLKFESDAVGLVAYSSQEPLAFTMFEEGELEEVLSDFARLIRDKLWFQ